MQCILDLELLDLVLHVPRTDPAIIARAASFVVQYSTIGFSHHFIDLKNKQNSLTKMLGSILADKDSFPIFYLKHKKSKLSECFASM